MKLRFNLILVLGSVAMVMTSWSCASLNTSENRTTMRTDFEKETLSRSQYYQHLGDNYLTEFKLISAIDMYRLALLHEPKNQQARFSLAQAYKSNGQDQMAVNEIETLIQSNHLSKLSAEQLNFIQELLLGVKAYDQALEMAENYFKLTQNPFALWKMYEAFLKMKNYEQALDALHKLETKDENHYLVNLAKSEIYMAQEKWLEAEQWLKNAENENPFDELVLKKMTQLFSRIQNWSKVIYYAEKYIKYQKHTIPISDILANAALKSEEYQLAIDEFQWQKDYELNTDLLNLKIAHSNFLLKNYDLAEAGYLAIYGNQYYDDEIKYYLSQVYLAKNEVDKSNSMLDAIRSDSQYYADAQVKLAYIEYTQGDRTDAINRLRKAHLVRKDSLVIYKAYSDLLIENQNYIEAVALIEKGVQNTMVSEDLHANLAFCHYKLKNYSLFRKELNTAMKINPANVRVYEMLTELWFEDNKKTSEIEYFARVAQKLESKNENIMKILAWTMVDQNRLTEAVAIFENLYDKNPKDYFYSEMLAKIYQLSQVRTKSLEYNYYARNLKGKTDLKVNLNAEMKNRLMKYNNEMQNDQRLPASIE